MWTNGWRDRVWSQLDTHFDVVVIGGGITGAGILREAAQAGYKVLLVEAHDFSSGTSSRSSKLVHGGLRYLKNFQFKTTLESVSERQNLLKHGEGLIHQLDILFASYEGDTVPAWQMGLGLVIYGIMAGKWQYARLSKKEARDIVSCLNTSHLVAGFPYYDAQTDDARLTLRVLQEGVARGGLAVNYTKAISFARDTKGMVRGVIVQDQAPEQFGREAEISADLVISATGAWADKLREKIGQPNRLRPLRGSHLVFSKERLPLPCSISINHPKDGRPVFAFPWEGATIIGTTDIDTHGEVVQEPSISSEEAEYLLEFARFAFPRQAVSPEDVLSTWAGIRPVVNTGKANPSKESREHAIWYEDGLLTVTGGKLTTFRVMARDTMRAAHKHLLKKLDVHRKAPILSTSIVDPFELDKFSNPQTVTRLYGRYGIFTPDFIINLDIRKSMEITQTDYLWGELEWAAAYEGVVHLDDLLLRRTRLGLLVPNCGMDLLDEVRDKTANKLGWDEGRWNKEAADYKKLIQGSYQMV